MHVSTDFRTLKINLVRLSSLQRKQFFCQCSQKLIDAGLRIDLSISMLEFSSLRFIQLLCRLHKVGKTNLKEAEGCQQHKASKFQEFRLWVLHLVIHSNKLG